MRTQAVNPYLPNFEYIPFGRPHVFGGRVYLYGAHDRFNGKAAAKNDYVCWSADTNDLSDWRYEGVIFRRTAAEKGRPFKKSGLTPPDVARGADGKYYFYFALGETSRIGVAVCDTPAGEYSFYGYVRYADGTILGTKGEGFVADPCLLEDDDGQFYLYEGRGVKAGAKKREPRGNGLYAFRLQADMLTVEGEGEKVLSVPDEQGSAFAEHGFYRSPDVRKFNGKYYLTYTSASGSEICHAVSARPTTGFEYAGVLLDTGNMGIDGNVRPTNYTGDTAGALLRIRYRYYLFYHRQSNRSRCSRQACAEEVRLKNRIFSRAETTSCGLNGRALRGIGEYSASTACVLYSRRGARVYPENRKMIKGAHPYFTQTGKDRNHTPDQHIANFNHGSVAGFRYFEFDGANQIIVTIKGNPHGRLIVSETPTGMPVARIRLTPCKEFTDFYAPLHIGNGKKALYFTYEGLGSFRFRAFLLQQVTRGMKQE